MQTHNTADYDISNLNYCKINKLIEIKNRMHYDAHVISLTHHNLIEHPLRRQQ